jgi:hypothetical protein
MSTRDCDCRVLVLDDRDGRLRNVQRQAEVALACRGDIGLGHCGEGSVALDEDSVVAGHHGGDARGAAPAEGI